MIREISGLTVTFDSPVQIRPNKTIDKLIVMKVMDDLSMKRAVALIHNYKALVLWEGSTYDAAGQWTDTDVINRVKELVAPPGNDN